MSSMTRTASIPTSSLYRLPSIYYCNGRKPFLCAGCDRGGGEENNRVEKINFVISKNSCIFAIGNRDGTRRLEAVTFVPISSLQYFDKVELQSFVWPYCELQFYCPTLVFLEFSFVCRSRLIETYIVSIDGRLIMELKFRG